MRTALDRRLKRVLSWHSQHSDEAIRCADRGGYDSFRRYVAATDYQDIQADIERDFETGISMLSREKTVFFASTSGVTGVPKKIPNHTDHCAHT